MVPPEGRVTLEDIFKAGMQAKKDALEAKMKDPETVKRMQEKAKRQDEAQHNMIMTRQGYEQNADGVWHKRDPYGR